MVRDGATAAGQSVIAQGVSSRFEQRRFCRMAKKTMKRFGSQRSARNLNRREFLKAAGGLIAAEFFPPVILPAKVARPNVVFVMTDQQRYPYLGVCGQVSVRTPAMDSIAREGVLFTQAFCSTPQCSASRSSIMTSLYPHAITVMGNIGAAGGNSLPEELPSLGHVFSEAGYRTAYFGKWHLGGDAHDYGWKVYDECGRGVGEPVAERSVEFLNEVAEPFFLFASFVNPHDIYGFERLSKTIRRSSRGIKLPANLRDDLSKKPWPQLQYLLEDQGKAALGFTEKDWVEYLNVYEHLVEKADSNIGRILAALRQRRLEREMIVVFTSDHGDHGGGHGLSFKGPAMYEELVRIPLAISFPGTIAAGRRVEELVVNVDLLPTLCDLVGLPAPEGIHGKSLAPLLEGKRPPWRDFVIGEYYSKQKWVNPIRMVRTKDLKYTRYRKWGEELYDLRSDPGELNSLAADEDHKAAKEKLSAVLDEWVRATNDAFESLVPTDRAGNRI